jgi:hypothetical protein
MNRPDHMPRIVAIVAAVLVAGSAWLWSRQRGQLTDVPPVASEAPTAPAAAPPLHPLASLPADAMARLPPLGASDPVAGEAAGRVVEGSGRELLLQDNIVRRWVITIDALTRDRIAQRTSPVHRVAGTFSVVGEPDAPVLSPSNFSRYAPYVSLAEAINPKVLVASYRQLYPLFQQAYTELIRPDGYLNDRVIEVIDHLLATPDLPEDVELTRPSVMFRYADPDLEAMSVGRKALLRMGPDNARRVQRVLESVRAELAADSKDH